MCARCERFLRKGSQRGPLECNAAGLSRQKHWEIANGGAQRIVRFDCGPQPQKLAEKKF